MSCAVQVLRAVQSRSRSWLRACVPFMILALKQTETFRLRARWNLAEPSKLQALDGWPRWYLDRLRSVDHAASQGDLSACDTDLLGRAVRAERAGGQEALLHAFMHVCDGGAAKRARAAPAERPAAFRPRALSVAARFSFTGRAETWTVPRGGLFRITARGAKAADGAHRRGPGRRPRACLPVSALRRLPAACRPAGAARASAAARCAGSPLHACRLLLRFRLATCTCACAARQ